VSVEGPGVDTGAMDRLARPTVTRTAGPRRAAVVVRMAATDSEVVAAGALTAEAYHADRLINDDDEYADELRDAARRAREATLLVAVLPGPDGDVVVGTITLAPAGSSYAEVARPGEVELRMLGVAPETRRRGIAEALMRASMRETVALGAGAVVLSTLGAMTTAQRLYDRLGFRREPERDWGHEGVALRVYSWHVPAAPGVRVEDATWRPVEVRDVDGWQVGLSGGFTRRANSAVPAHHAAEGSRSVVQTLDDVEQCYRDAGQPSVVRVRRTPGDDTLDLALAARGYAVASRTWVMVLDLPQTGVAVRPGEDGRDAGVLGEDDHDRGTVDGPPQADGLTDVAAPDLRVSLASEPDAAWLECWLGVKSGGRAADADVARAIVTGSPALYLAAWDEERVVGVLRAALADDWVGLSCLAVSPRARGRGLARTLTAVALETATGRGACHAFLQVEDENSGARRLYESLGFVPAARYHYRER